MLLEIFIASSVLAVTSKVIRGSDGQHALDTEQIDSLDAATGENKGAGANHQALIIKKSNSLAESESHQQLNASTSNNDIQKISSDKNTLNNSISSSLIVAGAATAGRLLFQPLLLLSFGLGIYSSRTFLKDAYDDLFQKKKVTAEVVLSFSTIGALFGGYLIFVGLANFFYYMGEKLVLATQDQSHKSLIDIFEQPESVFVLINGVETETSFEDVRPGDRLLVRAGQVIPFDGVVLEGMATIDQHALTGEAQPAEREEGDQVFAATVVLSGKIYIEVQHSGEENVAAQISHILNNTSGYELAIKNKSIELSDKGALPTLLLGALALPLVGPQGMITVWTTSIGYGMRIAGPITMLNFLNSASAHGILIKDGRSLELLSKVDVVVFDKTGTLTQEKPNVADIHLCDSTTAEELLIYASAAEYHQKHPIAKAILAKANELELTIPEIDQEYYEMGYGIKVQVSGHLVHVGSDRYMQLEGITIPDEMISLQEAVQVEGHSIVMVAIEKQLAGAIELQPTIRPETAEVVAQLHQRNLELVIISGDQEQPTRKLAQQLGIDRYFANTLPEHKADLVEQMQSEGRTVCFVGDGINDSIALKKANVSVSLSGATTAATDTAQIVLMEESLHQLPFLFTLGHRFDSNLKLGFANSVIPGVIIISGVFFFHWGLIAALGIWVLSFCANLLIAMEPLLNKSNRLGQSQQSIDCDN